MEADDPVIQRVRDARRQLQAECGNDVHKMLLWAMQEQKKYPGQLVRWEHPDEILDFVPVAPAKPNA